VRVERNGAKVEGKVVEETVALDSPLLSVSLPFDISNRVLYVSSCARGGGLLFFLIAYQKWKKPASHCQ
jgi:hypothetical protein